jgi:serine/threonine protein kinase
VQHAHQHGVVHRDIKPGNILLDTAGRPFVADFGLALRDQDVGHGPRHAGTPAYMSPEALAAQKLLPHQRYMLREAVQGLVDLYEGWGRTDQADAWRRKLPPPDKAPGS